MAGMLFLFIPMSFAASDSSHDEDSELMKVLQQYRIMLLTQGNPSEESVRSLAESLDGRRWADLDYENQSLGNWHPYQHLQRVRQMALAWGDPEHALGGDDRIKGALFDALDDWIEERYEAVNWWFNQIGAPRLVRDIVVLLGDGLDEDRRGALLETIAQHQVRGTGANLVWTAELALHYGCLTGDRGLVEKSAQRIQDEITVGEPQGIQRDWSFFQHGARLQTFHYGRSYLDVVVAVAWQLRQTDWALAPEKIDAISNYILEGMQWMIRGRETVPGTMDRMVSRPGTLRQDLRPTLRFWRDIDPERQKEMDTFIARQGGESEVGNLTGFRHFPNADFTAYHRPEFSFFLKTISDRTHLTESINEENLLGGDLNTGDHYIITDSSSYHNLPPVWDWGRLPGVTRKRGSDEIVRGAYVGGVGDRQSGLAAMDYRRSKGEEILAVRRIWTFHEDWVLALFGGWDGGARSDTLPYTTIDQRRLRGDVIVGFANGESTTLQAGEHELDEVRYLWHDGLAYLMLEASPVCVWVGEATGSWYRINRNRSEAPISEEIFLAVLEHGGDTMASGFAITPVDSAERIDEWLGREPWTILQNDENGQAIRFGDGVGMAAFYTPGKLADDANVEIAVDRPCLVLWRGRELYLADPTHEGGDLRVTWRDSEQMVTLPPEGKAVRLEF